MDDTVDSMMDAEALFRIFIEWIDFNRDRDWELEMTSRRAASKNDRHALFLVLLLLLPMTLLFLLTWL
jgi:hypothetical protein